MRGRVRWARRLYLQLDRTRLCTWQGLVAHVPEFQSRVSHYTSYVQVHLKNVIGVNKSSTNTISDRLSISPRGDESCRIVRVCCTVSRHGEKPWWLCDGVSGGANVNSSGFWQKRLERAATWKGESFVRCLYITVPNRKYSYWNEWEMRPITECGIWPLIYFPFDIEASLPIAGMNFINLICH